MNNKFLLLGMILLIVPNVISFNCEYFTGINRDNCITLNNSDFIADLIYTNHSLPDFTSINEYNSKIVVNASPDGNNLTSKTYIKNAWINIISINPSISYDNFTYIPNSIIVWTEYGYNIQLPTNYYNTKHKAGNICKIVYFNSGQSNDLNIYVNHEYVGNSNKQNIIIVDDSSIVSILDIGVNIRADYYVWNNTCKFYNSKYSTESVSIEDTRNVKLDSPPADFGAVIIAKYHNTTKGYITDNGTSIILHVGNSSYSTFEFEYYANFTKKPYDILELEAIKHKSIVIYNLFVDNNTFYTYSDNNCSITGFSFFNHTTKPCIENITGISTPINVTPISPDLTLLMMLAVMIFVLYLCYVGVKHFWGKYILIILLFIPSVSAVDCGLSNLADCISQKIFDFVINLLNAPLQPLLSLLKNLLSNPPSISLFSGIWAIIIYCLSMFYCFLIMYSGLQFIMAGHNVVQRELAKEWLKNTIIMIILIQASFYLYGLILDIGSIMTTSTLSLVDPSFFQLTADNIVNTGLQFFFTLIYVFVLVMSILFLSLRYIMVAIGIIFVPIGIFCYFVPPIKSYGRLILNLLGILIFSTFIDSIIILACSKMLDISMFQDFKILVMITCLLIINTVFIILVKHIIHKTGSDVGNFGQAMKYIKMV